MSVPDNAVAIIGLAGKFPGADDVEHLWSNIRSATTSISRFTEAELEDSFPAEIRNAANFVRARAILKDVDLFDAEFFGMLPREAALTDPQHRLLLECASNALEDGGYDPSRYAGAIGVFAGCSMDTYLLTNVLAERLGPGRFTSDYQVGSYDALLGALPDTLATRIAYKLNLRGPAVTVQSACSTSLLAIAQACQSLLLYQSDMTLAGGVSITFPQKRGYIHQEGGMVSPDGVCRPFDDAAGGTVFGDGAAMVLLKRLADAIADGDHIYAVIRGSAVNNDGSDKVGFTAPSVRGQADVIAGALAAADVEARSIGYVECHGTATPLGDPIEFAGLVQGFGADGAADGRCALGSVKANVGHLDAASGATGLIKAALALHHREIPPLANFRTPNRHIDLVGSPFYFPAAPVPWPQGPTPRRAGVSSFGVGGTNVHVVLEEAPAASARSRQAPRRRVLPLSARSEEALVAAAGALADRLAGDASLSLDDVAFTLQAGRRVFERRAAVACTSREEAITALRALARPPARMAAGKRTSLVFLFPGQGAQTPGMARSLYRDHPSFRAMVDEGIALATPIVGEGLRAQLLEPNATGGNATLLSQPALFIFEFALARLWMSWGLRPDAMVGHSVGEFVAASLAGVFSFEDGCRLIANRARIMQDMTPGAMLAVRLPEAALATELGDTLDLAAVNAPSLCVASGPLDDIEALKARLTARGVACRRLEVSHAFHSRALDPVLAQVERAVATVQLAPARLPFASCVTGAWATAEEVTDPAYWARHGRATVRFADALSTATQGSAAFLLEVGPGHTLSALAPQIVGRPALSGAVASLDVESDDPSAALAALWTAGFTPDWTAAGASGRRISLPTYRFQRRRHWIERTQENPVPLAPGPISSPPNRAALPAAMAPSGAMELQDQIVEILEHLTGIDDLDRQADFIAQGFDSLLLGQVARALEKKFRTRITFRQLLTEFPSVARLAAHLQASLPAAGAPEVPPGPATQGAPSAAAVAATGSLSARQRDFIAELTRRVGAHTPLSKAKTQQDRAVLADPRTAAGFRREWKELVYPVIAARAKGAHLRDIDGNDYIDLVNGFGQTMLGHSPDFVTAAIAAQLQEGFPIGPQSPLAGEVAALVSELTGDERVSFCNTGSEAVMAALRVARTVTGRERIVVFGNDYHGQFDEVLVRPGVGHRALPVAPGIPPEAIANMIVLPYGAPQSLEWLEIHGGEVAAVLVEPVQSRHPSLRPRAFLHKVRAITEARGAALIFDEIVTGFRVHPGGMQAVFGIRADLATYGKVVGGGMPIGILAGKARFMDALDGGTWGYGDDSIPEVAPTFVAGTFVRHPLALAAAKAVLSHLKAEGPGLQERLAARMGGLVETLNRDLERRGLATRVEGYSSWFHLSFASETPLAALFWPQMRLLGVHIQEGFPCFLTTAHTDADIAAIGAAFRASLDALEAGGILERRAAGASPLPVAARLAAQSAPLTEPQLEILTAAQMSDQASCAFNESVSIALAGELDASALAAALNAVIARHQALRGRVGRIDEHMHFAPKLTLDLRLRDCASAPDPDRVLADIVAADARTPFDLWTGPLVRATLVRLASERHVLLFTAHHIVCDGWSINIILNDLATHYRMSRPGPAAVLPAAPLFSDYARAQAMPSQTRGADLRYWTALYGDLPALPDLPADRQRPAERSYAGATVSALFDAGLLANLKKTGAAQGATLFSVLFTALQTVLGRLCDTADIVLAVPVAGQHVDDEPELVGHCVHMLPFRAPLAWETPFALHVRTVAQRLLEGFEHAGITYGTLVRALPLQRVAGRLPLTEVQFNLERLSDGLEFGGPSAVVTPNTKAAVNFDVFVNVIESAAGLRIDCDYNTDLFDASTIGRWLEHYRCILEGLCAAPGASLSSLPLLSAEQAHFVLDAVNESAAAYPGHSCVHELFAARVAAAPGAVACLDAAGTLTYAELDRQSTRLAQEILGVTRVRQGRIAIATDRSRALPVSLLGVMKAGYTYVPLDVSQPLERLRQIAMAAQIDGIICQDERIRSIVPYAFAVRLDQVDLNGRLEAGLPRVSSDDPAYILFTSGSTGVPKGVEVSHRSLTNVLCGVARLCEIGAGDTVIASSTITFDVAAAELYAPLIVGARIVLADRDQVRGGFPLVALAQRAGATLMQATPTLWRMLLEAGFVSRPGLKMIAAGEPLTRDLADRLLAGGGRLWNLYGPTETTVYSSGYEIEAGEDDITIGRPMANTRLYILDDRDRLVPPGAVGRLFIGGDGLARGYFDRRDLTARSFRTIALAGRPPQRLYASGDLARLLPSGAFELRGRVDNQVKLRGFRIELEEIEKVLREAAGVRDCAVLLRADAGREPALVAYVVTEGAVPHSDLAAHLARRLPDYMVPAHWLSLAALPLTSSGKVDRHGLPPPEPPTAAQPAGSAPRTELERRIAAVWAGVIGRPEVGIHDPLFALGADSLQVFRIAARLGQEDIAIDARALMANPTVAQLAQGLEGKPGAAGATARSSIPSLADFRRGARRQGGRP